MIRRRLLPMLRNRWHVDLVFAGEVVAPPTDVGFEYTMPLSRFEYRMPENNAGEFTQPVSRAEFTLPENR